MSDYAWIVTRDHLDHKDVNVIGPRDAPSLLISELEAGGGEAFNIYDDDDELYFEGRITGDYDGFEPLDDFGTPDSGCTDIRYFRHGKWESL